jgi:ADP-ribose pyrophosphatase
MSLFDIIEHTIQYKGRVINLIRDKVKYSNGYIEVREVVEHSGGCVILGLYDENKIVMIKQHRYPIDKVIYELPAGKLNPGEEPLECAKREFEEETGYKAKTWQKLTSFYTSPGYTSELLHVFMAKGLFPGKQNLEPGESHIIIEIMAYSDAIEKIESTEINDGKTIVGILLHQSLSGKNKTNQA